MKSKNVFRQTVLPAPKAEVFKKLLELRTLQFIAYPYATFTPAEGATELIWRAGETFVFRFKLFGFIHFGIHTIRVIEFSEDSIYTHESNTNVPVWNHRIVLTELENGRTQYSDEVELFAGWRTPFIYMWASAFYAHRQKKWLRLLP